MIRGRWWVVESAWLLALPLGALLSVPLRAQLASSREAQTDAALQARLEAMTREPAVARAHWGVSVERMDGRRIVQLNTGQFFQPASNAKLFTTAAAMALLPMDERLTTKVVASGNFDSAGVYSGDLRIVGVGDANLSGRPVPYQAPVPGTATAPRDELRYVNELADQVKAAGITRVVGDVVGDDSFFPWEPYPGDWAIDDTPWYYGAPVSGLMVADGSLTLTVSVVSESAHPLVSKSAESRSPPPNREVGIPNSPTLWTSPAVHFDPELPYYSIDMQAAVGPLGSGTALDIQRSIGEKVVHVYGRMAADAPPYVQGMSIDDPAEYAAMALKAALEARGVAVSGVGRAKHQPGYEASFSRAVMEPLSSLTPLANRSILLKAGVLSSCMDCAANWLSRVVAQHTGPPLYQDIVITNKVSQNQHAELLLRQLGWHVAGSATTAQGARVVRSFLTQKVGIDPEDFIFYDGSGLSGHDLVTPRAATELLRYAAGQPWGAPWRASLPVGGADGSLRSRFAGPLAGRVFAKTGTLGEARALSGYLVCHSGQTVAFSVMVSAHTPASAEDEKVMDRMVAEIAAAE